VGGAAAEAQEWLCLAELASKLGRTPRTVLRWRRQNSLPFIPVGKAAIYSWKEVTSWLDWMRETGGKGKAWAPKRISQTGPACGAEQCCGKGPCKTTTETHRNERK
jgi:hypothetical protein